MAGGDAPPTPVPLAFVAVTLKVYEVPFVRPETVQFVVAAVGATDEVEQTLPDCKVGPTYAWAEYPMIVEPLSSGAVQDTSTLPLCAVAVTADGTPGTKPIVTASALAMPVPQWFLIKTGSQAPSANGLTYVLSLASTCAGVSAGNRDFMRAASPATWGAA